LKVKAKASLSPGKRTTCAVLATSAGDATKTDAVHAKVIVK